jgi:quinolinate synthase
MENAQKELIEKILELKKAKSAIILCHNYQRPEIYEIADFIGDSLELALKAKEAKADIIVFCGVDFMAESAKILNPEKKVLHPDIEARCPMAAMANAEALRKKKGEFPNALVVSYINTSGETKAESDIICTSANFEKIIKKMKKKEILFVPDRNMAHCAQRGTRKKIIPWPGFCYVHDFIAPDILRAMKKERKKAKVMAHPECPPDVLKIADQVCGTGGMIKYAKKSRAKEFIVATEEGMCNRLEREVPGKKFYPAGGVCENMKRITLEKVYECLKNESNEVKVEAATAERAGKALEKMLELG